MAPARQSLWRCDQESCGALGGILGQVRALGKNRDNQDAGHWLVTTTCQHWFTDCNKRPCCCQMLVMGNGGGYMENLCYYLSLSINIKLF